MGGFYEQPDFVRININARVRRNVPNKSKLFKDPRSAGDIVKSVVASDIAILITSVQDGSLRCLHEFIIDEGRSEPVVNRQRFLWVAIDVAISSLLPVVS